MTQGDLFRDEGIKQVEGNAGKKWFSYAFLITCALAMKWKHFSTDDIWGVLEDVCSEATHDNRAMGAVMRKAQAEGWIEPTDRVVKSNRPVCHSRPIRVWRSKLI